MLRREVHDLGDTGSSPVWSIWVESVRVAGYVELWPGRCLLTADTGDDGFRLQAPIPAAAMLRREA